MKQRNRPQPGCARRPPMRLKQYDGKPPSLDLAAYSSFRKRVTAAKRHTLREKGIEKLMVSTGLPRTIAWQCLVAKKPYTPTCMRDAKWTYFIARAIEKAKAAPRVRTSPRAELQRLSRSVSAEEAYRAYVKDRQEKAPASLDTFQRAFKKLGFYDTDLARKVVSY